MTKLSQELIHAFIAHRVAARALVELRDDDSNYAVFTEHAREIVRGTSTRWTEADVDEVMRHVTQLAEGWLQSLNPAAINDEFDNGGLRGVK